MSEIMEITEEEIIFVFLSENRKKILRFLRNKRGIILTNDISQATGINIGQTNYHCRKLSDRKMLNKEISIRKATWSITEKGLKVIQEVDKREKSKEETP